jgi:protein-tyrosine phosphatase
MDATLSDTVVWRQPADFHSHILPEMDDGSNSVEASLEMLSRSAAYGCSVMVATPHFYPENEDPDRFLTRRAASAARLLSGGYDPTRHPRVLLGAEVAYFSGIGHCADLDRLAVLGTRTVLVEMPFCRWTDSVVDDILSIRDRLGLCPVLAHIERYRSFYSRRQLSLFIEEGVAMQLNASNFAGRLARYRARRMVASGAVQLIGSDCHNLGTRPPNLGVALRDLEVYGGESLLSRMAEQSHILLHGAVPLGQPTDM